MRTCYFDCFSGASGDMIIAALLDAGASIDHLRSQLTTLPVSGFEISAERIKKQGFAATTFDVRFDEDQPHRHLSDVLEIIRGGQLSSRVTDQACAIFRRLAEAEAVVHGTDVEKVHFHEVGAIDAIVDVTGACVALEQLDVDEVACSAIPTGSGTVACAHGVMPVPAPATAQLLKGVPLADCDEVGELTTPTGAAILTTLAQKFSQPGGMSIEHIGYGAGQRDGQNRPNLLRVLIGESHAAAESDTVVMLQANIDDQNPEQIGYAVGKLLDGGALDAYCHPIYMKKGRPGLLLTVLCEPEQVQAVESLIFAETTTFGIRRQLMQRSKLERRHETVTLPHGDVRMKIGSRDGRVVTAAPEFEDCRRIAEQTGAPVREVMDAAIQCWREQQ
ncbi:MAG: nickel pincer cofactor biosynthesis protein LarC [Planctomycetota bacterium]|nr:nickel pincer cofactor biosynthesis protein LarC [Planctomycetota bacterium]